MAYNTKYSDLGFDIKNAIGAAQTFYEVSGINVTLIDVWANALYSCNPQSHGCTLCKTLHHHKQEIDCNRVRLYGSQQAERFGGKYIFFCPMGLVFFASPLSVDGSMRAALIGGPVLMIDPEQYVLDDLLLQKGEISGYEYTQIESLLREIPQRDPVKTRYLSELLFNSAAYVCLGYDYFASAQKRDEQQSDIGEYIQKLKIDGGEGVGAYPIKKEKELIDTISAGDKHNARRLLNEILGYIFFSSGGKFEIIRARVLELVVLLSRAALDGGADIEQIFGLNYKYLSEIHTFKNVEDLSLWLSGLMNRFSDSIFNMADIKHVDVMYKAMAYVKERYAEKITLEDVSKHVYLSPSYFSKIFKEEMNTSFNAYLNKVRIGHAKRLLLQDDINLIDISNMVGYEDQSYFSKVFKKLNDLTPGKYRELRGKKPAVQIKDV